MSSQRDLTCDSSKIYGNKSSIQGQEIILSIGNFDGFHLGHQHLIQKILNHSYGLPLIILTFFPHPRVLFSGELNWYLSTLEERVSRILNAGAAAVVVQDFSLEFAQLSAHEFCENFLVRNFNIKKLFLGYDFRFGKNKLGDAQLLRQIGKEYGWEVLTSDSYNIDGLPVSSSRIRNDIDRGRLDLASELLGRDYCLGGVIIRGDERGRKLGFPTANLDVFEHQRLPGVGVYVGAVTFDSESILRQAVINVGYRPTFGDNKDCRIEIHILDFSEQVYGRFCRCHFFSKLRDEQKFPDVEALQKQLVEDIVNTRKYLDNR